MKSIIIDASRAKYRQLKFLNQINSIAQAFKKFKNKIILEFKKHSNQGYINTYLHGLKKHREVIAYMYFLQHIAISLLKIPFPFIASPQH